MMNYSYNNTYREVCENLGWTVREYETDIDLAQYSPAGEDFSFNVSRDRFVEDVRDYAYGFDPDEHIEMWVEARRNGVSGVPPIRRLVEDADDIAAMLDELSDALLDAADEEPKEESA